MNKCNNAEIRERVATYFVLTGLRLVGQLTRIASTPGRRLRLRRVVFEQLVVSIYAEVHYITGHNDIRLPDSFILGKKSGRRIEYGGTSDQKLTSVNLPF